MKLSRENLRIVVVDDNATDRSLLVASLSAAGFAYPPTQLGNGEIALEFFKYMKATGAVAPHVILLDINMPLVDGVRALHKLREASAFSDLPVIILSGEDDPAKRRELAPLGIFRILKKQANCANVIAALDDFIGLYNHEVAATQHTD